MNDADNKQCGGYDLLTASKSKRGGLGHRSRAKQWPLREIYLRLTNKLSIFK
jgi:hypothetical protein